ncbi:MAG: RNA polymerase subunit sigma [Gemmataceae bacterium]|nr:RNA polymerase subunit sigma [Gemmataceae bacterium]
MSPDEPELTVLLRRAGAGDRDAADRLFHLVEAELRARARACLRHESTAHSLQTTVLIDGAFQQLVGRADITWADRAQFYRYAARAMRHLLVDHARGRLARENALGGRPARLDEVPDPAGPGGLDPATLVAVHEALDRLSGSLPELFQLVELHVFGGWELKRIADDVLGLPYGRVKRPWQRARAWLHRELEGVGDGP